MVSEDPEFVPITDDKPFLAGNVRHVLSLGQVRTLFSLALAALAAVGVLTWAALRRRGDPGIPGRPFAAVAGLALLIGANFLLVEHLLVMALFRRIFVFEDSLGLGAVSFLAFSGLGSLFAGQPWRRRALWAAATVALLVLLVFPGRLSELGVTAVMAPVALATGTFFPTLFERAAANPVAVFALDAVGAGFGAVAATFVPILWGFDAYFMLAAGSFFLTAAADAVFHGPSHRGPTPAEPEKESD